VATKKTFVLRLDEDSYKAIEKWAADEFRSVNGQLEWLIDKALKEHKRTPAAKQVADTSSIGSKKIKKD